MKHLSKWFIATLAGVALFSSSCVDQVKFGDSFLEKAPGVAVTQDTIFGKATGTGEWVEFSKEPPAVFPWTEFGRIIP